MRNASHGRLFTSPEITTGQGDFEFASYDLGVLIEHFVEIAHAKEEKRVGILAFDLQVLCSYRAVYGMFFQVVFK